MLGAERYLTIHTIWNGQLGKVSGLKQCRIQRVFFETLGVEPQWFCYEL